MPTRPQTLRQRVVEAAWSAFPPDRVIRRGPPDVRRVALTFDDGPDDRTSRYLDVLDACGVPATFFIMGDLTGERPERVREYVRRGHQLGGHGWDHRAFPTLGARELRDQLDRTAAVIGPTLQGRPWVRPPYGKLSARSLATVLGHGYTIALWSFDSLDYDTHDVDQLVARCAPEAISPGEVLLFHEGQDHTLAALPRIIDGLRGAGYECVTMADLIRR
jgi:peptidoglycan/xylan/chitin deacetylase (PgdA/CDA1 family)